MNAAVLEAHPATPPLVRTEVDAPRDSDGLIDLDAVVAAFERADLLESADASGWSYVVPHGRWRLRDDGRRTRLHGPHVTFDLGADPFDALERLCAHLGAVPDAEVDPSLPALTGGLLGVLAYELSGRIERLPTPPADDRGRDLLSLRVVEVVCAVPPARDAALLLARPLPVTLAGPDGAEADARAGLEDARGRLARAARHRRTRVGERPAAPPRATPQVAWTSLSRADHLRAIRRVLEDIAAGEVFQVNLTQRLSARWPGDVHALYRSLRAFSPAAYGAALPDPGVASISPETFLGVDGRTVTTRPIKGTRPRAGDAALDAALADDLATAIKDRAENVMVVDLERNDLGRVCRPGSIRVPELTRVQELPTVWHLVSTIRGVLTDDVGYGRLLRATFPSGSITGAPKIAAMTVISALEPVRRGAYCGAIGFLAPGRARLSVAIRTAVLHRGGEVDHGAGGGIVADSDPDAEHAESLDKAAAFLRAVSATRVATAPGRTRTAPRAPSAHR